MARILMVVLKEDGNDGTEVVISFPSDDAAEDALTQLASYGHKISQLHKGEQHDR